MRVLAEVVVLRYVLAVILFFLLVPLALATADHYGPHSTHVQVTPVHAAPAPLTGRP